MRIPDADLSAAIIVFGPQARLAGHNLPSDRLRLQLWLRLRLRWQRRSLDVRDLPATA